MRVPHHTIYALKWHAHTTSHNIPLVKAGCTCDFTMHIPMKWGTVATPRNTVATGVGYTCHMTACTPPLCGITQCAGGCTYCPQKRLGLGEGGLEKQLFGRKLAGRLEFPAVAGWGGGLGVGGGG